MTLRLSPTTAISRRMYSCSFASVGKDQQHRPAGLDRLGDLVVEWLAWAHVARRDPTRHAPPRQLVDDFERGRPVFAGMADEQEEIRIGHRPRPRMKLRTAAMSHAA